MYYTENQLKLNLLWQFCKSLPLAEININDNTCIQHIHCNIS